VLTRAELVAFLATTNAERAIRFYGDKLELELLEQTDFACVFKAPNATVRVAIVSELRPAPYTVLGWQVADLTQAAAELAQRGVQPLRYSGLDQDEHGIWRSPGGARILWFSDPDGNVLSLTQL
jgi:catechol 2,3-dioxygenase-like lactoylglutathione lyase family enzyme